MDKKVPDDVKDVVTRLVDQRFGGDWERAFQHYARVSGADFILDEEDAHKMLADAGVDDPGTRGAWAKGVAAFWSPNMPSPFECDPPPLKVAHGDEVKWQEFASMFRR